MGLHELWRLVLLALLLVASCRGEAICSSPSNWSPGLEARSVRAHTLMRPLS